MEYRKFKIKGKQYITPMIEDDYVIPEWDTKDVFDVTQSNWNFQKHKNYEKTLSKTITFE